MIERFDAMEMIGMMGKKKSVSALCICRKDWNYESDV